MAKTNRAVVVVPEIVDDFTDDHLLALAIWLIVKANQSDKPYPWKLEDGTVINLQKNQAFLNVTAYAKRRGVSRKVVRDRLATLERRATIGTQEVHRKGLIVTVINLEKYQLLANYRSAGAASRATSGPQEGPPYHLDNHLDKSGSAPARVLDWHNDVLSKFPKARLTSPEEARREFVALDPQSQLRCAARVAEWAAFFETVHKDERQFTPGLHNWIKKGVYDEPRETWEMRVKYRKSGGGWAWG